MNCPDHDRDDDILCTCREQAEIRHWYALWEGERAAGLLRPKAELDQELRDAGRGHLVR